MNYKQKIAIENSYKKKLLEVCPTLNENSGIYILTREEQGFKYAYVGQAKHLLSRLAQHFTGFQHIDLSLKKHKLWSKDNPTGWGVDFIEFSENELNKQEQEYIKLYANQGWQMRNKTAGSQSNGKFAIAEQRSSKGYYNGLKQGYSNAIKQVKEIFNKYLIAEINGKETKIKQRKLKEFYELIGEGENGDKDC